MRRVGSRPARAGWLPGGIGIYLYGICLVEGMDGWMDGWMDELSFSFWNLRFSGEVWWVFVPVFLVFLVFMPGSCGVRGLEREEGLVNCCIGLCVKALA